MTDFGDDSFLSLSLHASEYPARQREALLESLRAGRLPGRLLYLSPAQAQRWLDYHAAWSPSRTDEALHALYAKAYRAAAEALAGAGGPPDTVNLVGVGAGGGTKDAELLAALGAGPAAQLHYTPLDASPALVAEAALQARRRAPAVALHPLVVDLAAGPALEDWLGAHAGNAPRVVSCFGMLPNMDATALPAWLAAHLRPEDVLLLSANLSPRGLTEDGPHILLQYDNLPARAWYNGVLSELGLPRSAYALAVEARPLESGAAGEGAWRVCVEALLREEAELTLYDETLAFALGQRLSVFHSQRFTVAAARGLLERAGLAVQQHWEGAAGEEGIFLCRLG